MSTFSCRRKYILSTICMITISSCFAQINKCNMTGHPNVDDSYTWYSRTDFIPRQGISCGDMYIGHVMNVVFDFVWHGRSTDNRVENFFRVGFDSWYGTSCDGQQAQYPSFWLSPNHNYLMLGVSDSDNCNAMYTLNDYGNITVDISHHIEIFFDDDTLSVNITGGGKDDYIRSWNKTNTLHQHIGEVVPVWFMSGKFGSTEYNRGNGTFSNIVITSSQFTNGTKSPTVIPSFSPSILPTPFPTISKPTADPSPSPSTIPTSSPSKCIDYQKNHNSDDGMDQIHSAFPIDIDIALNHNLSETVHYHHGNLSGETVHCDSDNASICIIECVHTTSCKGLVVDLNELVLDAVYIWCIDGCREMNVQIVDCDIELVHIHCDHYLSCQDASISISISNSVETGLTDTDIETWFIMDCNQTRSCVDVAINLTTNFDHETNQTNGLWNLNNYLMANISCFDDKSCNHMVIDTNDASTIEIELSAFRHSEEIKIYHLHFDRVHVHCGYSLDSIYIEYPNNALLDEFTILDRARSEYTHQRLPCEDIQLICPHSMEHCEFEYHLDVNPYTLANRSEDAHCFWMNIVELYHAKCDGVICSEDSSALDIVEIPNVYRQSFEVNMYLETSPEWTHNNNTNKTESLIKCQEYFGSINDTQQSMRSIDAVFEHVLNVMASAGSLILDFYGIQSTTRRDIECFNVDINTIALITNLTIESIENDRVVIDNLFADNSTFVTESSKLLTELFGVHVVFDVVEVTQVLTETVGIPTWQVIVLTVGVFLVTILFGIILYRYRRIKRQIMMKNPLVIAIGIADYDDPQELKSREESLEIEGVLESLPPEMIRKDIKNVLNLFHDELNYTLHPKYHLLENENLETAKIHWTKKEIVAFFKRNVQYLEENLNRHDGLVVMTSSHGKDGSILSSDYKRIPKRWIHRRFSKNPKMREIPRLFLFDCCDGDFAQIRCEEEMEYDAADSDDDDDEVASPSQSTEIIYTPDMGSQEVNTWKKEENNPDHNLVVIHAANEGFQSQGGIKYGSYLIRLLTVSVSQSLKVTCCRLFGGKYLGEMMNEIQTVLENKGIQLVVPTYTNGTERIVFGRNVNHSRDHGRRSTLLGRRWELLMADIVAVGAKSEEDAHSNAEAGSRRRGTKDDIWSPRQMKHAEKSSTYT